MQTMKMRTVDAVESRQQCDTMDFLKGEEQVKCEDTRPVSLPIASTLPSENHTENLSTMKMEEFEENNDNDLTSDFESEENNAICMNQGESDKWRNKKRKKWGQGTLQQCKHKNIFKNFGNIIIKSFKEDDEFKEEIANIFGSFEEIAFMDWVFKDIRLESKKDFIKGWLDMPADDDQILFFKNSLRELSHKYLNKHGLDFLKKSRMKHKEIHLKCLNPLIECTLKPHLLKHFRPDDRSMELQAMKLKNKW